MADFWDFLIVAVVFWFILRMVQIVVWGPRWARRMKWDEKEWKKKFERKFARHEMMGDMYGMLVGGIVCLFMGAAILAAKYLFGSYFTGFAGAELLIGLVSVGGFVLAAIGVGLIVAYIALSVMHQK